MKFSACSLSMGIAVTLMVPGAWAQRNSKTHWVATWATSEQQARAAFGRGGRGPGARGPQAGGAGGPQAAPQAGPQAGGAPGGGPPAGGPPSGGPPNGGPPAAEARGGAGRGGPGGGRGRGGFGQPRAFNNQTVRMIVRTSLGGKRVRVHFSNTFGDQPVTIDSAHIALRDKGAAIVASSDHALTFTGDKSVTIPPGAEMISDAVDLDVPKLADLAISVHVPEDTGPASLHSMGLHTTYITDGDTTAAADLTDPMTAQSWYWLSAVDVDASDKAGTIVAFGDSITDGATSTPDTDRSWPSALAARLQTNSSTSHVGIVNEGISGNQVLTDGAGVSALARFDRDVLAISGAKYLMILESINDINLASRGTGGVTAEQLINGLNQMVERAHDHGMKVIGCTLTPYGNINEKGEEMRQAVNKWIRTGGAFDAVVDFDEIVRDPQDLKNFKAGYNNTDRLHPNDTGYKAMADGIDLKLFTK